MRAFTGFSCWVVILFLFFSCESTSSIQSAGQGGEGGSESPGDAGATAAGMGGHTAQGGSAGQPPGGAAGATGAGGEGGALDDGLPCANDDDCSKSSCADGVCCNEACEGACRACIEDATGMADGTCGFVQSGLDPNDDCAENSETCLDGFCDGNGACRLSDTGTECGTGPKKLRGEVCAEPDECDTGICGGSEPNVRGGRCCAIPCDCPQPSALNLLENPGFDANLSGWDVDLEDNFPDVPANAEWSILWDADQCGDGDSYSGALEVTIGEISNVTVRQCVPASAGVTYNMGGWFLATQLPEGHPAGDAPWSATCAVQFFSSMNVCNSGFPNLNVQSVSLHNEIDSTYTWKAFSASAVAPASTTAAAFDCFMVDDYAPEMSVILDKLYLSPSPAQY